MHRHLISIAEGARFFNDQFVELGLIRLFGCTEPVPFGDEFALHLIVVSNDRSVVRDLNESALVRLNSIRLVPRAARQAPVPESPITLLESSRMVDLIKTLRERYDLVILDTPPITSVGDSLTLSRMVDTNLLVVGAGLSHRRSVTWAKQMLSNVNGEICGAILNLVKRRQMSAYYYYYYQKDDKAVRSRD